MKLSLAVPTPLAYFASLVHSDSQFAFFEAAVSLAQDAYPDLDVHSVLLEVDQLLCRLRKKVPIGADPLEKLRLVNAFFYDELHFLGNANDYYDPDNSYLNILLHRRRGIPISMAALWMELAQGVGLAVRGVSFPGHFLVKVNLPIGLVILDPMTGRTLSREDLSEFFEPSRKPGDSIAGFQLPMSLYLKTATEREMIARMLHNLAEIYRSSQDFPRLLAVQERLVVLFPDSWAQYRDRGLVHAELGHTRQAVADLEFYLGQTLARKDDEKMINKKINALRQKMD
jgi:regulator of sirC expression with transglutaminase-like and TPR domain